MSATVDSLLKFTADELGKRTQLKLLWTNPNPTSAYPQSGDSPFVVLDLSQYSMVMVQFKTLANDNYCVNEFSQVQSASLSYDNLMKTMAKFSDFDTSGFYEGARWFYATTARVGFTDGYYKYYTSGTADWTAYNTLLVPYRIFGIKGVS